MWPKAFTSGPASQTALLPTWHPRGPLGMAAGSTPSQIFLLLGAEEEVGQPEQRGGAVWAADHAVS